MHLFLQRHKKLSLLLIAALASIALHAQSADSLLNSATLDNVVTYALEHQPRVQQALLDQQITDRMIRGKLADWYPQVTFVGNYQHNIDIQTTIIAGEPRKLGVENTSAAQFVATQNIFNRDVLLASSTASKVRMQAEQNTSRSKIDVVVNVTKAFYDLLATTQQIKVTEESITRLRRSLKDAQARYASGVSDKTDYKRAMILLSNAEATLKSNHELQLYKEEYLKLLMGYPTKGALPISYDTLQMERDIAVDTLQQLNVASHIDYKLLYTQRELQEANLRYAKWGLLPTLTVGGAYILNYQNNSFQELYTTRFPYSYVGATLTIPIFQGMKRTAKIQEQRFTLRRADFDLKYLQSSLNTEYTRALASYKSNLATYQSLRETVGLAEEVYDVINLQYKNGVRAYLDVTVAEADLRTARINYFNALYQVLAAKIDVQRALGQINY